MNTAGVFGGCRLGRKRSWDTGVAKVSPLLSRIPILGRVINYWWPTPPREPHVSPPSGLSSSIDFLARSVSGQG